MILCAFNLLFRPALSRITLRIMKLIGIILLTAILQVNARSVLYAQTINISVKNTPIATVMREIQQQTGYSFFFNADWLVKANTVTVNLKNASIKDALDIIFKNQPFYYRIINQTIVLKQKVPDAPIPETDLSSRLMINGKVVNEKGEGLPGASVLVKGTKYSIITTSEGMFTIRLPEAEVTLVVSYIGYKTKEVSVSGADVDLVIHLEPTVTLLKGSEIVSTGYQTLQREKATGSFEKIDNQLFNRSTGPAVLDRLEGTVPGVFFDRSRIDGGKPGLDQMTIRGLSTLVSNTRPLIVLDNAPYNGDVNNINPNDVESITVLKDAAAASIWGVRAGNGVIVITTKKGKFDQPMLLSFNTNLNMTGKPDLSYVKQMSTSDYIDVEKELFSKGNYDYIISDNYFWSPVTPVVDLLNQARSGIITEAAANLKIDSLRKYDVRNDYRKYFYRTGIAQQYALNLSGGSKTVNYFVSGGYDRNRSNRVYYNDDRITLRTALSLKPVKNLDIQISTIYTQSSQHLPTGDQTAYFTYSPVILPPYTRLADDQGNPLVITRDYRASFANNPGDSRLLNWQFNPLEEMNDSYTKGNSYDVLMNLGASYKISKVFSASVSYQYQRTNSSIDELNGAGSYFARNLINLFTQAPGSAVEKPIPVGGILSKSSTNAYNYRLLGGFNVNKTWNNIHEFTALAGAEVSDNYSLSQSSILYGYDDQNLTFQSVDNTSYFNGYTLPQGGGFIPSGMSVFNSDYRFTSLYAKASYTYNNRYAVALSARKDASNLFGITPNKRGVPLWSAGANWNISNESFYTLKWLPVLRLRTSYGYNGNTNNSLTAKTSISYRPQAPYTNLPYSTVINPPNKNLSWEKVGITNLGIDFGIRNNRLSGTIEYYIKNSRDLLWLVATPLSTGFQTATTNSVSLFGKGIDIGLHSINITGKFIWNTDLSFSYASNKVTKYDALASPTAATYLSASSSILPIKGKPLYAVYSYKWAGLDPQTGDPQGYMNKQISKDYASLVFDSVQNLHYSGSSIPVVFGNLRNTITYKNFSISANIIYKLGYYFKRNSINYGNLLNPVNYFGHADYSRRWQQPGDEKNTTVPSMIYPDNSLRDQFYTSSSALITKGDHIRLQDVAASYLLNKPSRYFKSIRIYANVSNLGIIWRANKEHLDPDYGAVNPPAPRSVAFGLSADF